MRGHSGGFFKLPFDVPAFGRSVVGELVGCAGVSNDAAASDNASQVRNKSIGIDIIALLKLHKMAVYSVQVHRITHASHTPIILAILKGSLGECLCCQYVHSWWN
jgi:hypothetical protein